MIFKHIEGVRAEAIFSDCGKYRYKLTIDNLKTNGNKIVCVIMQNPSIANSEVADRSAQFLEKLIFTKGYHQFDDVKQIIIVNQFAYVQTNDFDGSDKYIGKDNDKHIKEAIDASGIVLIAWGASNGFNDRKQSINLIIGGSEQKELLQTKKHPSRGTYIDFIEPYSI